MSHPEPSSSSDSDTPSPAKALEATASMQPQFEDLPIPEFIGRYRVERILGQGSFGLVYLAHDEQLHRPVAIKVPHARLVSSADDAEAYIVEARTVAALEHPHIVPVHDVGSSDQFPCFIVSRFVEGCDLATRNAEQRPSYSEAADLVATVAEALHFAHTRQVVHRDIKPGNILVATDGTPYVVDFGLALRIENTGRGARHAGSPAYMSPEQARGESHRVDGRSDIYGLGAVFYELLTGQRTFFGSTVSEILSQIASQDPRPPRQIDDRIPKELERICLKALARRATERYTTAHDMAEDLRHFLIDRPADHTAAQLPAASVAMSGNGDSTRREAGSSTVESNNEPVRIVPKGLRSFDAHDSDFFLELLPGPRDRDGLPDSLRFWKQRIEPTDPDEAFSVGLMYGPSGCGKSSMVKAGLLPRLSADIQTVYVEATPEQTEAQLLHGLRKRCPGLPASLTLTELLIAIRNGQGRTPGQKVLIVLDQFEQWLHGQHNPENTELVHALRQCDGGRVQCLLLVRDDFWMAVTRFLRELEVTLVQGRNISAVDLFPELHARKVLVAFGRAFGTLNSDDGKLTEEQQEFIRLSVAGLAEDGKVVCVRLAMFAEMIKSKPWTLTTLQAVGGTAGVGVAFLEETFAASTASPRHRYHQRAARGLLRSLLPDSRTDLKGQWRSRSELLEASGYDNRPADFDDLIQILDSDLRLITPTDPQGATDDDDTAAPSDTSTSYYQLTHDYLVPSIRQWLESGLLKTRAGRAQLMFSRQARIWSETRRDRDLPSLRQYNRIKFYTRKSQWTPAQQQMMASAWRYYMIVNCSLLCFLLFAGVLFWVKSSGSSSPHNTALANDISNRCADSWSSRSVLTGHWPKPVSETPT